MKKSIPHPLKTPVARVLPWVFPRDLSPREKYAIVLLPQADVAERGLSLAEALAFARGYNDAAPPGRQAVIAIERHRSAA